LLVHYISKSSPAWVAPLLQGNGATTRFAFMKGDIRRVPGHLPQEN
jgi:hypothetical protein